MVLVSPSIVLSVIALCLPTTTVATFTLLDAMLQLLLAYPSSKPDLTKDLVFYISLDT